MLLHLIADQACGTALFAGIVFERRAPTGGKYGNRAEQVFKLLGGCKIKAAMRTARQLCYLAKRAGRDYVVTFLKDESRYAAYAELSRDIAHIVDIFLKGIADKNQRIDAFGIGFANGVTQYLPDLGPSAEATYLGHAPDQLIG